MPAILELSVMPNLDRGAHTEDRGHFAVLFQLDVSRFGKLLVQLGYKSWVQRQECLVEFSQKLLVLLFCT